MDWVTRGMLIAERMELLQGVSSVSSVSRQHLELGQESGAEGIPESSDFFVNDARNFLRYSTVAPM